VTGSQMREYYKQIASDPGIGIRFISFCQASCFDNYCRINEKQCPAKTPEEIWNCSCVRKSIMPSSKFLRTIKKPSTATELV
ncbi:MAG: hypothetical protein QXO75_03625, partial [Nitrososphaerota archaeon]